MDKPGGSIRMLVCLFAGLVILPRAIAAQQPGSVPPGAPPRPGGEQVWYMLGRVVTFAGAPVLGAKVAVYLDSQAAPILKSETSYNGEFDISLHVELNQGHRVKAIATKAGYARGMEVVDVATERKLDSLDVVLRETEEDSEQLPFASLISNVSGRLMEAPGPSPLESERSKSLGHAKDLLDSHDSNGAMEFLAKALAGEPKSLEHRTLLAVAMLEAGSWSGATRLLKETADLNAALEPGSRRSEPNMILGVLECWRGNPENASGLFLKALEVDSKNPLLLQELGRSYLLQQNWSGADDSLARAIQAGASPEAHLMRAEALLSEAKPGEAQAEMQTYLGGRKPKELPLSVRLYWMKLGDRIKLETESNTTVSKSLVKDTPEELFLALPELNGVELAKSQAQLQSILQEVGDRVEAFFRDFHNTISKEEIRQEALRRNGKVGSSLNRNFQYLLLTWPDSSQPTLNEYRTETRSVTLPFGTREEDFMLTRGFASAAVYFLPAYQKEATFAYLGDQRMDGHQTHVIIFAQRPEIARLMGEFKAGQTAATSLSQGVAWVDRDTSQIIRMRTELLYPIPAARLERETTEIHYMEVNFKDASLSFWLPRDVVVTVDWKGKLLRNRHTYSDFHLFTAKSRIIATPAPPAGP